MPTTRYTYDTNSFTPGSMVFGSANVKTIDSISNNFKILTCSEMSVSSIVASGIEPIEYNLNDLTMAWDGLSGGGSVLNVIDFNSVAGLQGSFLTLTDVAVVDGVNVQVATDGAGQYILKMQKLSDFTGIFSRKSTSVNGMDWQLDKNHSVVIRIVTGTVGPGTYSFRFGDKDLLCGMINGKWSPIVKIDEEPIVTENTGYNFTQIASWQHEIDGVTTYADSEKSVTWTIDSDKEIVSGFFLDGSRWIVDNGDIRLISVSPQAEEAFCQTLLTSAESTATYTATQGTASEVLIGEPVYFKFWSNVTVINPDVGKLKVTALAANNPTSGTWSQWNYNYVANLDRFVTVTRTRYNESTFRTAATMQPYYKGTYNGTAESFAILPVTKPLSTIIINPFNGRSGRIRTGAASSATASSVPSINSVTGANTNMGSFDANIALPTWNASTPTKPGGPRMRGHLNSPDDGMGKNYDDSQRWIPPGGRGSLLKAGDMVVTSASHNQKSPWKNVGSPIGDKWEDQSFQGTGTLSQAGTGNFLSYVGNSHFIDFYGVLTVISYAQYDLVSKGKSFRPPVNWDPSDRANAPIMQENMSTLFEYNDDNLIGFDNDVPIKNHANYNTMSFPLGYAAGLDNHRTGSVFPFMSSSPFPNSGSSRSYDSASSEYASSVQQNYESQAMIAFNTTSHANAPTAIQRAKIRRALVQRGIDTYGAARSLGLTVYIEGGHSTDRDPQIMLAYMMTGNADLFELLNFNNIGNTLNGTLYPMTGVKSTHTGSHERWADACGSYVHNPLEAHKYYHVGRFKDLEIIKIETGFDANQFPRSIGSTAVPNGLYQKITINPPHNVSIGQVYNVLGLSDDTHSYDKGSFGNQLGSKNATSLYNTASKDPLVFPRWNWQNNTNDLAPDSHCGGYIRNKYDINNQKISRIIASRTTTVLHKLRPTASISATVTSAGVAFTPVGIGTNLILEFTSTSSATRIALRDTALATIKIGDVVYSGPNNGIDNINQQFTTITALPVDQVGTLTGNTLFVTWTVNNAQLVSSSVVNVLQGITGSVTGYILTVNSNSDTIAAGSMLYWTGVLPGTCVIEEVTPVTDPPTFIINKSQNFFNESPQAIALFNCTENKPIATSAAPNSSSCTDPNSYNSALVFYLRDNIFDDGWTHNGNTVNPNAPLITYPQDGSSIRLCDMAPHTQEDFDNGLARVGAIAAETGWNYPNSAFPYSYVYAQNLAYYSMIYRGCVNAGLSIPAMIDGVHKRSLYYTDNYFGRAFYYFSCTSTYEHAIISSSGGSHFIPSPYYDSLLRKFCLNGVKGPAVSIDNGPVINSMGVSNNTRLYSTNRNLHSPVDTIQAAGKRTWIETATNVQDVSIINCGAFESISSTNSTKLSIPDSTSEFILGEQIGATDLNGIATISGQFLSTGKAITSGNNQFTYRAHPSWAGFDMHKIQIPINQDFEHTIVVTISAPYALRETTNHPYYRNPLSYEHYIQGKSLFLWPRGRPSPIEMVRVDDDHWTQWGNRYNGSTVTANMPPFRITNGLAYSVFTGGFGGAASGSVGANPTMATNPLLPWISGNTSTRLSIGSAWTQIWKFPDNGRYPKDFLFPYTSGPPGGGGFPLFPFNVFWAKPIRNNGVLPDLPAGAVGAISANGADHS